MKINGQKSAVRHKKISNLESENLNKEPKSLHLISKSKQSMINTISGYKIHWIMERMRKIFCIKKYLTSSDKELE